MQALRVCVICVIAPLRFLSCNDVGMRKQALQLDRAKSNPLFDSWRLARELAVSKNIVTLQGHCNVTVHDHSTDYLNTRAAVLHNHLHQQDQRTLLFTEHAGVSALQEVLLGEDVEFRELWGRLTHRGPCNSRLIVGCMFFPNLTERHIAEQSDVRLASKVEAPAQSILQPSVVAVQGCAPSQECWLMSSGHGNILLIKSSKTHGKSLHQY